MDIRGLPLGGSVEPPADGRLELELRRIHGGMAPDATGRAGLTDIRRETPWLAYDRSYFDEPRVVSLGGLAAELGVSDRVVSGRLRRAPRGLT